MKKKWMAIITILIALILLIPQKSYLNDGGTVIYDAILYRVTNYHSMYPDENDESQIRYLKGIEVKILGFTVYNNVKFEKD